jgi:NAD(P)-dependent dehydrogenase (short-subunit alcohol dehydrogenase family)
MVSRNYGRIINIGSVTSVAGYAGLGPYGASRGGIRQLTMSLADDWGKYGITVNCLAPGWFRTEQNKVLYEDKEWVEYLKDRIPLKRRYISRLGSQPLRHRTNSACGWRNLDRLRACTGEAAVDINEDTTQVGATGAAWPSSQRTPCRSVRRRRVTRLVS